MNTNFRNEIRALTNEQLVQYRIYIAEIVLKAALFSGKDHHAKRNFKKLCFCDELLKNRGIPNI